MIFIFKNFLRLNSIPLSLSKMSAQPIECPEDLYKQAKCFRCRKAVTFLVTKIKPAKNNVTQCYLGRCPDCPRSFHPFKSSVTNEEEKCYWSDVKRAIEEGRELPLAPPRSTKPGTRVSSIRSRPLTPAEQEARNEVVAQKAKEKAEKEQAKADKKAAKEAEKAAKQEAKAEKKRKTSSN